MNKMYLDKLSKNNADKIKELLHLDNYNFNDLIIEECTKASETYMKFNENKNSYLLYLRPDIDSFTLFKSKWSLLGTSLENPLEIGKFKQVTKMGYVLFMYQQKDCTYKNSDYYQKMYNEALNFENAKVYPIANKVIKFEALIKKKVANAIEALINKGIIVKGSDIPVVNFEDEANEIAKIIRQMQTKSLEAEVSSTNLSKNELIYNYANAYALINTRLREKAHQLVNDLYYIK